MDNKKPAAPVGKPQAKPVAPQAKPASSAPQGKPAFQNNKKPVGKK